jgi:hypothetical protein
MISMHIEGTEVGLTETTLEFTTLGSSNEKKYIALSPKWTDHVSSEIGANVYGLFVENMTEDDQNLTGFTTKYIITPTLYSSNISSIENHLSIQNDTTVEGNIQCTSARTNNGLTFDELEESHLPSKIQILESLYTKDYIDQNIVSVNSFQDQVAQYNLPTINDVNTLITNYVTGGGAFNYTDFVTYANIGDTLLNTNLVTEAQVGSLINDAFVDYDLSAYVTNNNLFTLIANYNTLFEIPSRTEVSTLILSLINVDDSGSGTIDVSGLATVTYVDTKILEVESNLEKYMLTETIASTYVTSAFLTEQLINLGNSDGSSFETQIFAINNNIASLQNTTYTRTYVNENFVSTSNDFVNLNTVNNLINNIGLGLTNSEVETIIAGKISNLPTLDVVNALLNSHSSIYTVTEILPRLSTFVTSSDVSSQIADILIDYTATTLETELESYVDVLTMETKLNTYSLTVLENRVGSFLVSSDVNIMIDNAMLNYTSSVLPNAVSSFQYLNENDLSMYLSIHAFQTENQTDDKIMNAISTFKNDTLPTFHYLTDSDLSAALATYTTSTLQTHLNSTRIATDSLLSSYVTFTDLSTKNFVDTFALTSFVTNAITNKVDQTTMSNSINSALNTYTNSIVSPMLNSLNILPQVASYISTDTSSVLKNKITSFLFDNDLNSGITSALSTLGFINETQINIRLNALDFIDRDELANNYYSRDQLFNDTNAMLPVWLSQNEFMNKEYIDSEITEKVADSFDKTTIYLLEQLSQRVTGNEGNVTHKYLEENYVARDMWLQWCNHDALSLSEVLNLIGATNSTLTNDFSDLTESFTTLSLQTNSQLASLATEVSNLASTLSHAESCHANLEGNVNSLENNVIIVTSSVGVLQSNNVSLQNQLSVLESNVITMSETQTTTNTTISDQSISLTTFIEDKASNLEGQLITVKGDLENLIQTSANVELLAGHFVTIDTFEQHLSNCDDDCGVPITNFYNYNLSNETIRVDLTNNLEDTLSFESGFFKFNHPFCTLDGVQIEKGNLVLIRNLEERNGVYEITDVDLANVTTCLRLSSFNSQENITNTLINVFSLNGTSSMNGSNFVVSNSEIIIDETNIEFIQVTYTNHGSMGYQNASNVSISGGVVSLENLLVDTIQPTGESIIVRLPDSTVNSTFQVTAKDIENERDDLVFQVDGEGTVVCRAFHTLSDANLKQNDKTIENPIALVRLLEGRTFEWIDERKNTNGPSFGFIAQEVAQNFPSLVTTTLNDKLAVDYPKVVAILVEAIKEIYQHVENAGLVTNTNVYTSTAPIEPHLESFCQTNITKNLIGISGANAETCIAQLASTDEDNVVVAFLSTDAFTVFTNGGANTLDGVPLAPGMTILIKNCQTTQFNGIYDVQSVTTNTQGMFSMCTRSILTIQGALVFVQSDKLYEYQGEVNDSRSFLCVEPRSVTDFVLNSSPILFSSLTNDLKSMAFQNSDNVAISGGTAVLNSLITDSIQPKPESTNITFKLQGNTPQHVFAVHNGIENVFSVNGLGVATAHDFFQPSDMRLKKNIITISDSLNKIKNLRGVTFDWIDTPSLDPQYGFIAQEVRLNFPSLVTTQSNGNLAMDYSKVVSILVESVKELASKLNV